MRPRKLLCILLTLALIGGLATTALACTPMGVGKNATVDGSVMVAHTCDGWYDNRIQIIPGGEHEPGEVVEVFVDLCQDNQPTRPLKKTGEIPQVEKTNTYFHVGYPFMNDKQVMMGEFTWMGREEVFNASGMLYIANLEMLGLQRASTAREAVLVMGELAEKYGYGDGGETLIVGDPNEAWVFEVCGGGLLWTPGSDAPGAHWAAQRIPDDGVFVGANRARLGVIDFEDTDNFLVSTDLTKLPLQMGWWQEGEPFDFAKIFNPTPYGSPFYASRREWRAFSLLKPSETFPVLDNTEAYPFSVVPDKKLSVKDLMDVYSDHLEGTVYDLTADEAAGPFGNPTRWGIARGQKPEDRASLDWERAIALFRCSYSFVSQSRSWLPDAVGGVLWFGEDSPDTTVYVPIYCGVTEIPAPWTQGARHVFDRQSAWWAFNLVNNWANIRWDAIYEEIREKKASYEDVFFAEQDELEAKAAALYEVDPELAVYYLTEKTKANLNKVEQGWWDFAWHLIGKYYDGGRMTPEGAMQTVGYPTEYLKRVDFGGNMVRDLEEIKNR